MTAYYNEYDQKAAAWLRELIKQGHIADGVVDERSIEDVTPNDLAGFTQCHFFAGIGVWSYALRRAGWADDRAVWTGSCPCQPFSAAGKGAGFADERHLWPAFHHLISQCQPAIVLGEQVASKDGLGWLDLVQADLEATGYASGAVDLCAAGVGAPHIRQRLWWVGTRLGNATSRREWSGVADHGQNGGNQGAHRATSDVDGLADASAGRCGAGSIRGRADEPETGQRKQDSGDAQPSGLYDGLRSGNSAEGQVGRFAVNGDMGSRLANTDDAVTSGQLGPHSQDGSSVRQGDSRSRNEFISRLADNTGQRLEEQELQRGHGLVELQERLLPDDGAISIRGQSIPGPTNGHWRDADWLFCRDGKWRPVEPGTSPLVNGAAARVGRLRGYGNAIVAQAAQAFVESVMESLP